ncbi:hypothetical protein Y032_0604g543 [Ancylostoma ceylanicum]|uniref:Uncharacterized protein n=1 Tax=Ancylostoma ceylanicum TaxID=53326 RepID=A0A016WLC8_9BILA|nr:hypothetical protein Y032_0604g543 [Ancylostoma ceylanicum]
MIRITFLTVFRTKAFAAIHEPKCLEKFHIENNKLPKSQRRSEPKRPPVVLDENGAIDVEATNEARWDNAQALLVQCEHCGRRFAVSWPLPTARLLFYSTLLHCWGTHLCIQNAHLLCLSARNANEIGSATLHKQFPNWAIEISPRDWGPSESKADVALSSLSQNHEEEHSFAGYLSHKRFISSTEWKRIAVGWIRETQQNTFMPHVPHKIWV